jgi:multimeric flavodoxin WrbA
LRLGTPADVGYISGALKHFFDTAYYPSLDHVAGRPYGLCVHGNNDTVGAANAVDKVATRLALSKAADVLEVIGAIDAGVRQRAYELGGTLAATLME